MSTEDLERLFQKAERELEIGHGIGCVDHGCLYCASATALLLLRDERDMLRAYAAASLLFDNRGRECTDEAGVIDLRKLEDCAAAYDDVRDQLVTFVRERLPSDDSFRSAVLAIGANLNKGNN